MTKFEPRNMAPWSSTQKHGIEGKPVLDLQPNPFLLHSWLSHTVGGLQTHSQPRSAECIHVDTNSWTLATCEPKGAYPKALKVGSGPFVQRILCPGNLKQASEGVDGLWVNISTWPWGGLHRQEYKSPGKSGCGVCTSWHGTQVHTDPATRHSGSFRWTLSKKKS